MPGPQPALSGREQLGLPSPGPSPGPSAGHQRATSSASENNPAGAANAPQRAASEGSGSGSGSGSRAAAGGTAAPKRAHPSITDQKLLQVVRDMRERANKRTETQPADELQQDPSPSEPAAKDFDTLDLTSHRIANLPDALIEHIKHDVVRLSLATNRLTRLPTAFANLQRLKYLNIRQNGFTEIPSVICELPALQILDMARNKIRLLPESPGNLINLRVLAIGDNQLQRLPLWLGKMTNLLTVRLTPNPLQWPPPEFMQGSPDLQAEQKKLRDRKIPAEEKQRTRKDGEIAMSNWITELQAWINAHPAPVEPQAASDTTASPIIEDIQSSPTTVSRTSPSTSLARDLSFTSSAGSRRPFHQDGPQPTDFKQVRDATDPTSPSAQAEAERNSYFRRLSMLPPSTINKAVPQAVLDVVDATRGVLYALSQIHTALEQYIMFAVVPATSAPGVSTDDGGRVSAPINRVLDIASASMAHFIDALDRFDSMCRRGTPPASVIRGVFVACKDSVQIFRKVVGVLQLQLRALLNTGDVRYTRTLLLMLHGSIAEVSNSYRTLGPQIQALMPYLSDAGPPSSASASASSSFSSTNNGIVKTGRAAMNGGGSGHAAAGSTFSTPSLPSIAEQASSPSKPRVLSMAPRLARNRHGGNFSARDVEQGAMIAPANANQLSSSTSSSNNTAIFKSGTAPAPTGSMEQLINEEKRRLEAAIDGELDYDDIPPVPPLPLSELSVHLNNNSSRSRSGSGTGSENGGQLLSASSSTASGAFNDTISSSGGGLVSGSGSSRRQAAPSGLGTLPSVQNYHDEVAAGFPRSPGGRPITLASANGFGPRRGENGLLQQQQHGGDTQDVPPAEGGRKEYFDHAHSRSLPSRPVRRGRTGSTASAGSTGAKSAVAAAVGGGGGWGRAGEHQPPLPPPSRPHTAGNTSAASGATRPRTAGSSNGRRERERDRDRTLVADDHLLMLTDQLTTTASGVWGSLESYLETAAQQQEQNEEQQQQQHQQQQGETSLGLLGANANANGTTGSSSLLSRRMRDLNVQLSGASTLTDQLQATLHTIRASLDGDGDGGGGGVPNNSGTPTVTSTNVIKQPAAEIKKLWEDGNVLVRTVVQISTLIRGITSEHDFPREMLRSMGELTSVCSQLMVHMHFLTGF
ncbi:unnamed protein product [Tilletia caries]|uniref:Disease resistance R13L4/SHOC-2-like LRR domain-containing protein n=1 Tax=Tilletia caries TaxID=13290 RepID=A0A177VE50_9BASI|nr:hypothetical protein CF336_g14 [Tilletia laevis]KAE8265645.1 hypothetical protein A4X03_0g136 [Tilletia caries]CAD6960776.1 unnamed protein product [Tilletia caries]